MFRANLSVLANESDSAKVTIEITPHPTFRAPTQYMTLSYDQYLRVYTWYNGVGNIQDLLPELSDTDREMLMTGLSHERQEQIFGNASRKAVS